jgi:hypothetical protein
LLAAADLQDHLMVASNDLERLQRLLDDACEALMRTSTAPPWIKRCCTSRPRTRSRRRRSCTRPCQHMAGAITALQFQDMASQLIAHTSKRLRNCADRMARDAMGDDEDGEAVVEEAPLRPNPVTQDEMDAGSDRAVLSRRPLHAHESRTPES